MKCFRRHMAADFRHRLIIPNKFIDHFGGKISRTMEIESPNGNMYPVEVSKHMNKTVLRGGWEVFIDAHHIEENDSLLFRHIENSRFEVLVFDSDDCEKEFSCAGIKITCKSQERGVDYVDDTTRSSGSKRIASCQMGNSSYPRKIAKTAIKYSSEDSGERTGDSNTATKYSLSEDSGEDTEDKKTATKYSSSEDSGQDTEDAKTATKYSLSKDSGEDTEDTNTIIKYSSEDSGKNTDDKTYEKKSSFELDDRQTPFVMSQGNTLSLVQEEKVTALIQDVRAETPVFVAIMKRSHVNPRNGYLVISKRYVDEHFPQKSQTAMLQRPGKNKKWHPRFYIRKDNHSSILSGSGWSDFVHDNGVQEGDICVFERMKGTGKSFSLAVHLLRKSMAQSYRGSETGPKRVSSTHGKARVNSGAPKGASTIDCRTRAKASPKTCARNGPDNGGSAPYKARGRGHRARLGPLKSDKSGGPSEPPYILASTTSLTREQEKNVEKRARSLHSEVPIYVSMMNKSSVGGNNLYNVTICRKYAAGYLPAGEQTVTLLRAERSKKWEVHLQPMAGGAQALRRGWREFVHDNRLQVQDVCLYQLMLDQRRLTMMVHIIRHNVKR